MHSLVSAFQRDTGIQQFYERIDTIFAPFKTGNITISMIQTLNQGNLMVIEFGNLKTYPLAISFDFKDNVRDEYYLRELALRKVAEHFAAIRVPTDDHIVLGED